MTPEIHTVRVTTHDSLVVFGLCDVGQEYLGCRVKPSTGHSFIRLESHSRPGHGRTPSIVVKVRYETDEGVERIVPSLQQTLDV